jgi:acetate---CoA ligase (ADP-forming)
MKPENRRGSERLRPLIDPASVAVYGASANLTRLGGMPIALLRERGFAGQVYPINPKYEEVGGYKCYPDIASLPDAPDVIVIAVAAPEVVTVLRQAAARGIPAAVVFAAGFAEAADEEGTRLQAELAACAEELGIAVAGPNCMGFGNLDSHAYTTFTAIFRTLEPPTQPRSVALVTQSGSVCSAVYAAGRHLGVGFNVVVNTGNEANVEFSEYLEYLADRPGTQAIVGYVEGLRDGARFHRVASRMRDDGRMLALLKVGETHKGVEAAASHTAALAGSHAVYRAVFDRLCVVRAHDILHLADMAYLAGFRAKNCGPRVAILTISGAIGALLSDAFIQAGVDVPTLSAHVGHALHEGIPRYGMVRNPIDLTGNIVNRHGFVADALRAILASGEIDFVAIYAPGFLLDRMAASVGEVARTSNALIGMISTGKVEQRCALEEAGIPVFDDATRAVRALASLAAWHRNRAQYSGVSVTAALPPPDMMGSLLATLRGSDRRQMDEHEAKKLLQAFGVPVVDEHVAASAGAAVRAAQVLGYPVALKILSSDIAHKSDMGGVRINLADEDAVRAAYEAIMEGARNHCPGASVQGVVVQRQEDQGTELLLGVVRDPVFGPVMTVGLGGVWAEVFGDIAHAPLPVSPELAARLLRSLKAWPLLGGYRKAPAADAHAIAQAMASMSRAALALGADLDQMEINPLIARPDGVVAVDALVWLSGNAIAQPADFENA